MTATPETADFALDEMPGAALHDLLHRARFLAAEQGEPSVDCLHVLAALSGMPASFAYRLVARTGVNLPRGLARAPARCPFGDEDADTEAAFDWEGHFALNKVWPGRGFCTLVYGAKTRLKFALCGRAK